MAGTKKNLDNPIKRKFKKVEEGNPDPVSYARNNIFSPEIKQKFLDKYPETFQIKATCLSLGIKQGTFYWNLRNDSDFKASFDSLNNIAIYQIESVLVEALNSLDWENKRWAVDRLMKSKRLRDLELYPMENNEGKLDIVIDKIDIE